MKKIFSMSHDISARKSKRNFEFPLKDLAQPPPDGTYWLDIGVLRD